MPRTEECREHVGGVVQPDAAERREGDGSRKRPEWPTVLRIAQPLHQCLVEGLVPENGRDEVARSVPVARGVAGNAGMGSSRVPGLIKQRAQPPAPSERFPLKALSAEPGEPVRKNVIRNELVHAGAGQGVFAGSTGGMIPPHLQERGPVSRLSTEQDDWKRAPAACRLRCRVSALSPGDMQDDAVVPIVFVMSVSDPVVRVPVDLHGSGVQDAADPDACAGKIGTAVLVRGARGKNLDGSAVRCEKRTGGKDRMLPEMPQDPLGYLAQKNMSRY